MAAGREGSGCWRSRDRGSKPRKGSKRMSMDVSFSRSYYEQARARLGRAHHGNAWCLQPRSGPSGRRRRYPSPLAGRGQTGLAIRSDWAQCNYEGAGCRRPTVVVRSCTVMNLNVFDRLLNFRSADAPALSIFMAVPAGSGRREMRSWLLALMKGACELAESEGLDHRS